MSAPVKLGRMTRTECQYVRDNAALLSPEALAAELRRSVAMVRNELARAAAEAAGSRVPPPKQVPPTRPARPSAPVPADAFPAGLPADPAPDPPPTRPAGKAGAPARSAATEAAVARVKGSVAWAMLKKEFEAGELQVFVERYAALTEQFQGDVLATEEAQILKTIRCEILMSRLLARQRTAARDITRAETEAARLRGAIARERLEGKDPTANQARLEAAELALQAASSAHRSMTAEYSTYDQSHQRLTQDLKGTRQQRIDKIESGKTSFLDVIKELQRADAAELAGRQNEQMKRAAAKELDRLGRPTKFADGDDDRPILSADTVGMFD
jgi:predicted transcriptional regulator